MRVRIGAFIVPDATDQDATLKQIQLADETGLVTSRSRTTHTSGAFLDTWTLLSYAAGVTEPVRFVPDVLKLPLRPPALIAKSVASLDLLTQPGRGQENRGDKRRGRSKLDQATTDMPRVQLIGHPIRLLAQLPSGGRAIPPPPEPPQILTLTGDAPANPDATAGRDGQPHTRARPC